MGHAILRDILVIFVVAVPVVIIAHRLKFPAIVGFLVTGALIGPHALGFVPDIDKIRALAEVGVALLLFSIGLEFSFTRLKGWGRSVAAVGSIQLIITAVTGFAASKALGWNNTESTFLGCAIALSSTAIVMAVLSQKRMFDAPAGRLVIGVLIFQDIAVIPIMVFLKLFFMGDYASEGGWGLIALASAKLLLLASAIAIVSRWALEPMLRYISRPRSKELFVVVIIGLAIGAAYTTERIGLSFALGAFLAGLLVSATGFRFHAISEIAPFRYCFSGLFFVAAGMIFDPGYVIEHWGSVGMIVLFMILAKAVIVGVSVFALGYTLSVAGMCALMLAQAGEFSFMLVFFGWRSGTIRFDLYQQFIDAAAITMVIAPFLVAFAPKIGELLHRIKWHRGLFGRKGLVHLPDEDGLFAGHAIICGFGPLGMTVGRLLEKQKVPYIVLELNPETADRITRGGGVAYIGDGASDALLEHSGIERARLVAVAVPDHLNAVAIVAQARRMNPEIYIVTRSRYRDQVQALYDAGADIVICEELEGGIEMGRYILTELGVERDEISRLFKEIRDFGSADFF